MEPMQSHLSHYLLFLPPVSHPTALDTLACLSVNSPAIPHSIWPISN